MHSMASNMVDSPVATEARGANPCRLPTRRGRDDLRERQEQVVTHSAGSRFELGQN